VPEPPFPDDYQRREQQHGNNFLPGLRPSVNTHALKLAVSQHTRPEPSTSPNFLVRVNDPSLASAGPNAVPFAWG
jgi:hypothetical protein